MQASAGVFLAILREKRPATTFYRIRLSLIGAGDCSSRRRTDCLMEFMCSESITITERSAEVSKGETRECCSSRWLFSAMFPMKFVINCDKFRTVAEFDYFHVGQDNKLDGLSRHF